jgi:cbb3-type cytochrome oxidase subunit 3
MKRMLICFLFLFLVANVFAMNGPVNVEANLGDKVSVIFRDMNKMTITSDKGAVDEDGIFTSKTFFSMNPPYNLRIIISSPSGSFKDFDEDVTSGFEDGIDADCRLSSCILSAAVALVEEEVVEIVEENVSEEVLENVSNVSEEIVEVVEVESEVIENDNLSEVYLSGKAIFTNKDGSLNWKPLSIGIIILILFLSGFIFMILHRRKKKGPVLSDDERELEETEEKVKETEEKIKKLKEGKLRRQKIYEAKKKLIEEERELKEMQAAGDEDKIQKQEAVVEKAEDKVDKVSE